MATTNESGDNKNGEEKQEEGDYTQKVVNRLNELAQKHGCLVFGDKDGCPLDGNQYGGLYGI